MSIAVEIVDWRVVVPAESVDEARTVILQALRIAGIRVVRGDNDLAQLCTTCKFYHTGDCASI